MLDAGEAAASREASAREDEARLTWYSFGIIITLAGPAEGNAAMLRYRVSLCTVCLLHVRQNFFCSTLPLCFFLFFVVE
jgi:hypothetical protein